MLSAVSTAPQSATPPSACCQRKPEPDKVVGCSDPSKADEFALNASIEDDKELPPDWQEEDIVKLCWVLLKNVECLAEPATPLMEKILILNWIFTDPERLDYPFSFDFCVKAVCLSPHSELPYIGDLEVDGLRDTIQGFVRKWMHESAARYPAWVHRMITENPEFAVRRFEADPQWLNREIKREEGSATPQLFDLPS
ncbi:MAG: hypothetical protein E6R14_08985 [Thermomicrobiales bacterium]|nr:MAG: hypothetical protein E6R14_08985 [Thermomicrobiales bacterium]